MIRYFKEIDNSIVEYKSDRKGKTWFADEGWLPYAGTKSVDWLHIVDNVVAEYTEEEHDAIQQAKQEASEIAFYAGLYDGNPDLKQRVREYKALLESVGLEPTANITAVTDFVNNSTLSDAEKIALVMQITGLYNNGIVYNLSHSGIMDAVSFGYDNMDKLIKYLPEVEQ